MTRTFESPLAFKQSLEHRLRNQASSGADYSRRRQLVVFDRFLARVVHIMGESVILKGGLALELRLDRARTTKDVDLRLVGSPESVLDRLQEAGRLDLGDFMTFEVRPDPHHPDIQNEGMRYDGFRYRVEGKLAGKLYGYPFGVDVAFADIIDGVPETVVAGDILAFAGIAPPTLQLYPIESHIAEKLHAYTIPRVTPNSRVKDLPDLALLAKVREIDAERLHRALRNTFEFRDTHLLPEAVPEPPSSWSDVYKRIAEEDNLDWKSQPVLTSVVRKFLNPILGNPTFTGRWQPDAWSWVQKA
jgi:predicted nucleotidyltransferase component of viral defense system